MPKDTIIPGTDPERNTFYPKFGNNIEEALADMDLDPKMGAAAKTQALAWPGVYQKKLDAAEAARAATANLETQTGLSHDEVQDLINQLKHNPKYTPEIQAKLGTTPTESLDPKAKAGADQPVIEISLLAGHPDLKCRKHGHNQIKIMCKRGTETEFTLLSIVTSPHYVDPRPNLVPGQSEIRTYILIYVDRDQEVGQWSAPASVAVLPQP